jgi:hypothetical protein
LVSVTEPKLVLESPLVAESVVPSVPEDVAEPDPDPDVPEPAVVVAVPEPPVVPSSVTVNMISSLTTWSA